MTTAVGVTRGTAEDQVGDLPLLQLHPVPLVLKRSHWPTRTAAAAIFGLNKCDAHCGCHTVDECSTWHKDSLDVAIMQCHSLRGSVSHLEVITRCHKPVPRNQKSNTKIKPGCVGALQGIFFFSLSLSWSFYKFFLRGAETRSCSHTTTATTKTSTTELHAKSNSAFQSQSNSGKKKKSRKPKT